MFLFLIETFFNEHKVYARKALQTKQWQSWFVITALQITAFFFLANNSCQYIQSFFFKVCAYVLQCTW